MSSVGFACVACALVTVVGCAAVASAPAQKGRPADFRVVYEWQEGSLPPPYHYEYTVTVEPDGRGQIVFVPDYGGETVPKWIETFTVPADRLDVLYRTMIAQGLLKSVWRTMEMPPVGGSHQSVEVTVGGRQVRVADYLVREQKAAGERIFAASKALVPPDLFARLQARRDEYVRKHER